MYARPWAGSRTKTAAQVWATIYDIERFAHYLPMVSQARRRGDVVTFDLKFRIGFFSVGFEFTVAAKYEAEKWLDLSWTAGEPREKAGAGRRDQHQLRPARELDVTHGALGSGVPQSGAHGQPGHRLESHGVHEFAGRDQNAGRSRPRSGSTR